MNTTRCDRFEREALLSLERGELLDTHFTSCPDCGRSYRKYRFLLAALPHADQAIEPRPGWQAGVLAALGPSLESERRRQADGIGRFGMVAAFAGAAALAVLAAGVSRNPAVDVQPVVETTETTSESPELSIPAQKPPAKPLSAQKPSAQQRPAAEPAQSPPLATEPAAPEEAASVEEQQPASDVPAAPDPGAAPSGMYVYPTNLDSCPVTYTPEAYATQVKGLVVVRCAIKADGQNTDCRVLRGLPYMNKAILAAMNQCRTEPVTLDGKAVDSEHTWYIRLTPPPLLPDPPPELRTPPSPILENPFHRRFRFTR